MPSQLQRLCGNGGFRHRASSARILDESWYLKRELSSKITTGEIDDWYDAAMRSGRRRRQALRRRRRRLFAVCGAAGEARSRARGARGLDPSSRGARSPRLPGVLAVHRAIDRGSTRYSKRIDHQGLDRDNACYAGPRRSKSFWTWARPLWRTVSPRRPDQRQRAEVSFTVGFCRTCGHVQLTDSVPPVRCSKTISTFPRPPTR